MKKLQGLLGDLGCILMILALLGIFVMIGLSNSYVGTVTDANTIVRVDFALSVAGVTGLLLTIVFGSELADRLFHRR